MNETNELQPTPEVENVAAAVPTEPAPAQETPAEENIANDEAQTTADEADAATDEAQEDIVAGNEEPAQTQYQTKEEVVARAQAIDAEGQGGDKSELDYLKQAFYRLHRAAQVAARNAFIEAGGAPEDWRPEIDAAEENFKAAMQSIRQRRAEIAEEMERQKTENLERKLAIIERIKELATSPEEANQHFDEFKQLQAAWKEIKAVPAERATEIWKTYQHHVEQFYDLLKLNIEAREYDFRKNLEAKERLCEQAEALANEAEEDIVSAFQKLQALHAEYKEIGPVAKDQREAIWERFKAASTVINKRHQEHFEGIKAREEENLAAKTALCEKIDELNANIDSLKTFADWDERTKQVLELQAQWRTIGYANHRQNAIIFDRFRTSCDQFFTAKAEFFRTVKDEQAQNLEQKRKLVEEAEALKDSTEWRKTTDKLIQLQKQWKTIGAVPRKYSEQLWQRFTSACDHFFEAKNAAGADQRAEERQNLEAKRGIIDELRQLAEDKANATIEAVRELQAKWNTIGHVPFREKDALYKQYRAVADELYQAFGQNQARRRLEGFQKSVRQAVAKGESTLSREMERLQRVFENRKAELQTYENNLNFLNATSRSGNSLVAEMNRKVEKLREELGLMEQKIKALRTEMIQQQQAKNDAKTADAKPADTKSDAKPADTKGGQEEA